MKNFEMLQKVCIDEVLGAGIEPGNIVSWVINRRAKTRWGMCTKKSGWNMHYTDCCQTDRG